MKHTIVISGASTGIGRAISLAIQADYKDIVFLGRNKESLGATASLLKQPEKALPVVCDLSDRVSVEKAMREIAKKFPNIDAIVNCAGAWHNDKRSYYGKPLWEVPTGEIGESFAVNIVGPMLLTRGLLPSMINNKAGKIVNISGTFSDGGVNWVHQYVSKKAVEDFTAALAKELRPFEIQVNCIAPSDVQTPALKKFFPEDYPTALPAEEVAQLALFLLSHSADHITGACITLKNKKPANTS